MPWASGSKQSLNIQCLSEYVPKSFKTLKAESKRYFAKDLRKAESKRHVAKDL